MYPLGIRSDRIFQTAPDFFEISQSLSLKISGYGACEVRIALVNV